MSLLLSKVTPPVIRSMRSPAILPRSWSLLNFNASSGPSLSRGCEMSVLRSMVGAVILGLSINVALVTVLGGEAPDIIFRLLPRAPAFALDDFEQGGMDVTR